MATSNAMKMDMDTTPMIFDNRTFVPLRFIVDSMGGTVNWNDKTKEIKIEQNFMEIKMKIDQKSFSVNNETKTMDTVPRIVNGRTLVPIRFITEVFNYDVLW